MSESAGHTSGPPPDRDSLAPGAGPSRSCARALRLALDQAAKLCRAGRNFEAHECLEPHWLAARRDDPDLAALLRGWIHLAAALHHQQRGNGIGARAQTERAAALLTSPGTIQRAAELGLDPGAFPPR